MKNAAHAISIMLLMLLGLCCELRSAERASMLEINVKGLPSEVFLVRAPFSGKLTWHVSQAGVIESNKTIVADIKSNEVEAEMEMARDELSKLTEALAWAYEASDAVPNSNALGTDRSDGNISLCGSGEAIKPMIFGDLFGRLYEVNDPILTKLTVSVSGSAGAAAVCKSVVEHWQRALSQGLTTKDTLFLNEIKADSPAGGPPAVCGDSDGAYGKKIAYVIELCGAKLDERLKHLSDVESAEKVFVELIVEDEAGQDKKEPKPDPIVPGRPLKNSQLVHGMPWNVPSVQSYPIYIKAKAMLPDKTDAVLEEAYFRASGSWSNAVDWATEECTYIANRDLKDAYELSRIANPKVTEPQYFLTKWCIGDKAKTRQFLIADRGRPEEFYFDSGEGVRMLAPPFWQSAVEVLPPPPPSTNPFISQLSSRRSQLNERLEEIYSARRLALRETYMERVSRVSEVRQIYLGYMQEVTLAQSRWRSAATQIAEKLSQLMGYYSDGALLSPYDGTLMQMYAGDGSEVKTGQPIGSVQASGSSFRVSKESIDLLPDVVGLPIWMCASKGATPARALLTKKLDVAIISTEQKLSSNPRSFSISLEPVESCS